MGESFEFYAQVGMHVYEAVKIDEPNLKRSKLPLVAQESLREKKNSGEEEVGEVLTLEFLDVDLDHKKVKEVFWK